MDWAGIMGKVLILILGDEGWTCVWPDCVIFRWGGGEEGTRMDACSLVGRGALSGRLAFLSGRNGGGECSRGVGAGVDPIFGC